MSISNPGKNRSFQAFYKAETDAILLRLIKTAEKQFVPVLLPESARFLACLCRMKKPARILEIGTALGYSAQVMLRNAPDARLWTVERKEDLVRQARQFMQEAGLESRVTYFIGDAGEIVPNLSGEFDLIFMDGPKTRYIEYLPYLKRVLAAGGVLVCDNVLFNGAVTGEAEYPEKKASIIHKLAEFCQSLTDDKQLTTCFLPVGDGLSVSVKEE